MPRKNPRKNVKPSAPSAPKLIALDTEDDSNGNVKIINLYDGERHATFTGEGLRENAWNWIENHPGGMIWAVNTEYDLINLFGPMIGRALVLQYVGSGLYRALYPRAHTVFYDTLRHWPLSVKGMGLVIGLEKMAADFASVEYCRRDTEIAWRFTDRMLAGYTDLDIDLRPTLPGTSFRFWKESYYDYLGHDFPSSVLSRLHEAYYGGRVEIFRLGEIAGPTYHYDVNSLFPAMMLRHRYPDLTSWYETEAPDWSLEGAARVTLTIPACAIGPLPVRAPETGELLFPIGEVTGAWCYPEIRAALERGARLDRVHWALEFSETCDPFSSYVADCYARRLRAKAAGDELGSIFWKLVLNSLYGKFAQSSGILTIKNDTEFTIPTTGRNANVIWSAYVTSYARVELLGLLEKTANPYYCDTDSVFSDTQFETSTDLGGLKLEGEYDRTLFKGNKIYTRTGIVYTDKGPKRVVDDAKAKGVPRDAAGDFIRTGRAVFRRPVRFRESRRGYQPPNKWIEATKELRTEYRKRRQTENGETTPWTLSDYARNLEMLEL